VPRLLLQAQDPLGAGVTFVGHLAQAQSA